MEKAVTVPAYDLRISLQGTEPEVWRRLQIPETVTIEELHRAIQAAFGWENRHLFGLRCVDRRGLGRIIVGPDEAAEDSDAEPASGVVLSELLDAQATGPTTLEYEYDFGDTWTHTFELMGPATLPANTLVCADGANRTPVEDSGGVWGYQQLKDALADPGHAEHTRLTEWFEWATGQDADDFDPLVCDQTAVNGLLAKLSQRLWPEPPNADELADVVRPVLWLLERAANDGGLELTKDGYLRPVTVRQIVEDLGWEYRWPGKANREVQFLPLLRLREQLQSWKLLRKLKGRLVLTPAGRKLHDGGQPLWDFLAERIALPQHSAVQLVTRVMVHWQIEGTTPVWNKRGKILAEILTTEGYREKGGDAVSEDGGLDLEREVRWTLECLDLLVPNERWSAPEKLTDGGLKFLLDVQRILGN